MDPVSALKAGRLAAQSMFIDRYTVTRPGELVTDPETGDVTNAAIEVYSGKGKIQVSAASAENPAAGGHQFTVQSMTLHLPVHAGPFQISDTVTVTASPLDPERVGHQFRITALHEKTFATAQRLKVDQVVG